MSGLAEERDDLVAQLITLIAALVEISETKGQTLLGCCDRDSPSHDYPNCCSDEIRKAQSYGVNRGFGENADIAIAALKEIGHES